MNRYFSRKGKVDYENIYEANPGEDYIQENQKIDAHHRMVRMIISYLITFVLFGVSAGVQNNFRREKLKF